MEICPLCHEEVFEDDLLICDICDETCCGNCCPGGICDACDDLAMYDDEDEEIEDHDL